MRIEGPRCRPGWVYLAAIVDLFSRRVVGWSMSDTNDTALGLAALDRALLLRQPPPVLCTIQTAAAPTAPTTTSRA